MPHYDAPGTDAMNRGQRTLGSPEIALETPASKHRYTRRLFATIADRYDLITRLLSFGRDQSWKRRVIDLTGVGTGWRVLDLACGTGDLAVLAANRGASAVGLDFTPRMIELARRKPEAKGIAWIVGDMGQLPVQSGVFDLVTTGYGLRNVPDLCAALAEMHRALRPGGVLCAFDFDRPERAPIRFVYLAYLTAVGSLLGFVLHRDPNTYRYIPASIRRYPGARGVALLMERSGFTDVRHVPVFGGFMAIHIAQKR
jgi:demethylmenaquinone methyltransferase / 2-methoxy-6-polyprenyl-1,4-benzoquinol methylase